MRRAAPLLLVGILGVLSLVAIAGPASAAPPPPSANDCVSLQSAPLSTGLSFDVANGCDKRLACALTWTLTCENASGKATSRAKQESRFVIGASDTHHTSGSAATCKDGWKIDDVAWDCTPAGK